MVVERPAADERNSKRREIVGSNRARVDPHFVSGPAGRTREINGVSLPADQWNPVDDYGARHARHSAHRREELRVVVGDVFWRRVPGPPHLEGESRNAGGVEPEIHASERDRTLTFA